MTNKDANNDAALAITGLKQQLPFIRELLRVEAELTVTVYSELIENGCTVAEAVELAPRLVAQQFQQKSGEGDD